MCIRMLSGGMSRVAWFSASMCCATVRRKSASDWPCACAIGQPAARSGQSICSTKPARWIASYSSFIASASAAMYSSSLA